MVYLSLYLAGKLGIFRRDGGAVWKAVVSVLPLFAGMAVAISRTRDYQYVVIFSLRFILIRLKL